MSALKFTNPITALREMAQRRSDRQANDQTISDSLQRIKVGEYIDKHGSPSLALMVDGIAIRLVNDGNTCDTMRLLRRLRAEYIDKRWQGGNWPGDLDGDIKRITTQAAPAHSGTLAK
jgi:hypothetical protein